ncbi:P-loop NTPase fold protein [Streptomyces krungchingensis]
MRELKDLLYELYVAAGAPSLDAIASAVADDDHLAAAPGRDSIRRSISEPDLPARQVDVVSTAIVLARMAAWDADDVAARVRSLWVKARMAVPAGRPLAEISDPFALQVHRAFDPGLVADGAGVSALPVYVIRDHDIVLRQTVADAVGGVSQLVVLVGESCTGKTRACWEAIRQLPSSWRLWHPFAPTRTEAVLEGISQVGPRTVVWLDETQEYLSTSSDHGERVAAELRSLLYDHSRAPVLILGTVWPSHLAALSAQPSIRSANDSHAQARALLDGHTVHVPSAFTETDLVTLANLAESDPRLAQAVEQASQGRVVQFLAGAHELLRRWDQHVASGLGRLRGAGRPLAGLGSDAPSRSDLLGDGADAAVLAELIGARGTQPPLAIALLGAWGAGKSSLMLQIASHVQQLADQSLGNDSAFNAHVRQVSFNAWHYCDGEVWTGMIEHLFRELRTPDSISATTAGGEQAERHRLRERRGELADEEDRLDRLLDQSRGTPARSVGGWGSPRAVARLAAEVGKSLARDARARVVVVASWVAVLVAIALLMRWSQPMWASLGGLLGIVATPVAVALARLRHWRAEAERTAKSLRTTAEQRREVLKAEAAVLNGRLAEIDAAHRLEQLINDRAGPSGYRQRRGLLGEVHRDLAQLGEDLDAAHRQWRDAPTGEPPLQRIVLYVDDLDRCPPARVVEVLEAVHLMLSLPLFVVVVAVDPRWLLRALRAHHREYFGTDDGDEGDDLATPLNYLDKIFQIPFAVAAFNSETARTYARQLLSAHTDDEAAGEDREPTPPQAPMSTGDDNASSDPEGYSTQLLDELGPIVAEQSQPGLDLQPVSLRLRREEAELLASFAGLTPTPRAAKKLTNLYRLIRIGIPDDDLPKFTGPHSETGRPPDFSAVQVLLLVLVSAPEYARTFYARVLDHDGGANSLVSLLREGLPSDIEVPASRRFRHGLADLLDGPISSLTAEQQELIPPDLVAYRSWIPRLSRFSFYTHSPGTAPNH